MRRYARWIAFCVRNPKVVMLTSLQRKWVKALVMYPERQTGTYLKNDKGMCCLGQYCDVVDPNGWEPHLQFENVQVFEGESTGLPKRLVGPGHFRSELGEVWGKYQNLANMNDSGNYTWPQIAEFVVNNQDKVFA